MSGTFGTQCRNLIAGQAGGLRYHVSWHGFYSGEQGKGTVYEREARSAEVRKVQVRSMCKVE